MESLADSPDLDALVGEEIKQRRLKTEKTN